MTVDAKEAEYLAKLHELWAKAWPKDTPREPQYLHGEVALSEYLRAWAKSAPLRPAVIFYGHVTTYADLDEQSDRFAALLLQKGVKKGDRVAVFLPNCPQFHIVFFGILKLGAIHVPVSPLSRAFELSYELNDTDAEVIVALDQLAGVVEQVRAETSLREVIVTSFADVIPSDPTIPVPDSVSGSRIIVPGATDLLSALAALPKPEPLPPAALDEVAALNYTGGTTGMPKGCVHTQRDMVYTAAANHGISVVADQNSVFLSFFPEFWIAGENFGLIFPLFTGATLVLLARWDALGVLTAIQRYKVNVTAMPVDGAVELMDHPRFKEFDLSSLSQVRVVSFVKKLNPTYRKRWKDLTGTILTEAAWGMTETHTSNTFTAGFQGDDFDLVSQPIFVGLPVPGAEFKITDFETGKLVPLGGEGEIRVRTPSLLKSYWNKPEATAESLVDGWLRTGDIGTIDPQGFLHFLGRRKEMLKVKGMSVFPPEIEALLGQHPKVLGSGVVGRDDPGKGQVPVAFIQLKPEAEGTITPAELQAWCAERMAVYKVPEIRIIDALPMTATGKVKKQELNANAPL
ncbi:AMP-binding protein [Rhodopseudomonas palustris]|uniref:AMP-binding protein n=1 Tax=Rhodopseudomonas palustris (strain ATCC BAA-98 / CGA009) TaxID=258594 RepID=Q6N9T7_RHOPA|nr:AMP-binding protein [Rhodopseudomonas palustris]OPF91312.1 acyl-CoA synthetase [Rhodopseudomonas palustris]PPQ43858.1 acyl-CoA synthetase [Rhodopseudomonas palustris]QQM02949.1 Long-chain-fatty-acid--CoA ligase [Rhodopseudomonas palustris]RJF60527.1 acyl-CoA synthetase [Rhodopseudomonas palustris]WAB79122.1 AMP-binding protein [Rhodopseudomonas palustris]